MDCKELRARASVEIGKYFDVARLSFASAWSHGPYYVRSILVIMVQPYQYYVSD
jgi:hypothetical protein